MREMINATHRRWVLKDINQIAGDVIDEREIRLGDGGRWGTTNRGLEVPECNRLED
jgi:hypothetical protein